MAAESIGGDGMEAAVSSSFVLSQELAGELLEVLALADGELGEDHALHPRITALAEIISPALVPGLAESVLGGEDPMKTLARRAALAEMALPADTDEAQLPGVERGLAYSLVLLRTLTERIAFKQEVSGKFLNAIVDFCDGLEETLVQKKLQDEAKEVISSWQQEGFEGER